MNKIRTELVRIGIWRPGPEDPRPSRRFKKFRNLLLALAGAFLAVGLFLAKASPLVLVVDALVLSWVILHIRSHRPDSHERPPRFHLMCHYTDDLWHLEAARVDDLLAALASRCRHGGPIPVSDQVRRELDSLEVGSQHAVPLRMEIRGETVTACLERLS